MPFTGNTHGCLDLAIDIEPTSAFPVEHGSGSRDESGSTDPIDIRIQAYLHTDDAQALELIFEHLIPRERSWLVSRFRGVLDSSEAEDVLSTATLKAWNGRRGFNPEFSIRPWFHTIVRNESFDRLRQRAREVQIERESEIPNQEASSLLHGELDEESVPTKAREVMGSLSAADREILEEYITSGCSESWTTNLAKRRGVSSASLRVKKHRLIKRLQSALVDGADDGVAKRKK